MPKYSKEIEGSFSLGMKPWMFRLEFVRYLGKFTTSLRTASLHLATGIPLLFE